MSAVMWESLETWGNMDIYVPMHRHPGLGSGGAVCYLWSPVPKLASLESQLQSPS